MILYGISLLILLQSKIHSYKTIFTVRCGKGCCIGKTFGQISCALLQTNIFGIYFQICQIRWFAGCRSYTWSCSWKRGHSDSFSQMNVGMLPDLEKSSKFFFRWIKFSSESLKSSLSVKFVVKIQRYNFSQPVFCWHEIHRSPVLCSAVNVVLVQFKS